VSAVETWFWIAFVFACVIAVHPAIDIAIDCKWKMDDRIVWERSRHSPVWNRMRSLFIDYVTAFDFNERYMSEYQAIRRMAWARHFRGECTFIEAVNIVKNWTEKKK